MNLKQIVFQLRQMLADNPYIADVGGLLRGGGVVFRVDGFAAVLSSVETAAEGKAEEGVGRED